ncbi:hypothetical protein A6B43_00250 [Vespertiliibacter pulmonis]|uniref:Uncharacterized protein n=1 Tax=Vespertiliibacter pulmonis TaxID=1443036 RepID=A0A3N4VSF9_9PAST|nr:hypothetical protein [Vespertiliibacter pulmonis]QLB20077.1 hypothetical protein A6B43_00250 [Vespertiliibacter pulmonis]RPE86042.1 hypothetical protein EDC46_0433 [Vespertiliibacter pulmonis]
MVDIHQKGDGTETTNNDVPVVAPINMGKGLKWDSSTGKYNLNIDSSNLKISTGLHFTKDEALALKLSEQNGNLLQLLNDGLYYGTKAPADLANLYVDAVNGVDQHPDDVDGAGSEANPLRTFAYANRIAQLGTYRTIRLHTEQEHNCTPSNYFSFKAGKVTVFPYGPAFDEELKKAGGDNTIAFSAITKNGKAPVLRFSELIMVAGPSLTKEYSYPQLSCFRVTSGTNVQFNGVILRNDLSINIMKNAEATTDSLKLGELSRITSDIGGQVLFFRCKFESIGTPTIGTFSDQSSDVFFNTVDGVKATVLGFISPGGGEYNLLNTNIQDNMPCMLVSHPGWGQPINSSLLVSLAATNNPEKFAKRVYGAKIDNQNGVKILLAPRSDVSATLFK